MKTRLKTTPTYALILLDSLDLSLPLLLVLILRSSCIFSLALGMLDNESLLALASNFGDNFGDGETCRETRYEKQDDKIDMIRESEYTLTPSSLLRC
eukprot:scaffold5460_cov153-Skeletonema_dohrnii-CCMP3373.AAC.17